MPRTRPQKDTPIRLARRRLQLTQLEVAKRAGIRQSTYARIEQGSAPSREVARSLAKVLAAAGLTPQHVMFPDQYPRFEPAA